MVNVKPLGNTAITIIVGDQIDLSTHLIVKRLYNKFREMGRKGVVGVIPSYTSLTVLYEPKLISYTNLSEIALEHGGEKIEEGVRFEVKIPVCYDKEFALDQDAYMKHTVMSWEQIIAAHSSRSYLVYFLGFVPGFPYLGGLNNALVMPRKKTPRLKVPQGSIGVADVQTGMYPVEIPGGWQIIGRAIMDFDYYLSNECVLMGDYIKFFPIRKSEIADYKDYQVKRETIES